MADLTTTLSETLLINNSLRGSTLSVTTTGINDVFERILTITGSTTTTTVLATFAALPCSTSLGGVHTLLA